MFYKVLMTILLTCGIVSSQCQPGRHPVGVASVPNTISCNEVNNDSAMWFSLTQEPKLGSSVVFSWLNPPDIGSPVCPSAFGVVALSLGTIPGGVLIPGTRSCRAYVPLDAYDGVLIPLCRGCHSWTWATIPSFPHLIGLQFFAQTYGWALIPQLKFFTSNTIQVTIRP